MKIAIATQYRNDLILDNFLSNKKTKLNKTSDEQIITVNNYKEYINEVKIATGEKAVDLKHKALN